MIIKDNKTTSQRHLSEKQREKMSTPQEQLLELIDVEDLEGFKKFMNLNILWRDIKFFEEKYSILHIAACIIDNILNMIC